MLTAMWSRRRVVQAWAAALLCATAARGAARVQGAAPPAARAGPATAGRPCVLVDGCNCGLRFATGTGKKGAGASKKQQARLLDCGGLKAQGASDLVQPITRWICGSNAFGVCLMDGKADLGRHASRVLRPHEQFEIAFTATDVTADERILELVEAHRAEPEAATAHAADAPELGALAQLLPARGPEAGAAPGGRGPSWVQIELRTTAAEPAPASTAPPERGELGALLQGWARPASHVYTLSTASAECERLAAALARLAGTPAAKACALRVSRLRTSPVLCVTEDARLRSACDRLGALVVAPRVFYKLIGAR